MAEKDLVPPPIHNGVMAGKEHAEFNGRAEKQNDAKQRRFLIGRIKKIWPKVKPAEHAEEVLAALDAET